MSGSPGDVLKPGAAATVSSDMDSLSVIVTAYNFGPFVGRSLQSVHDALAVFHAEFGRSARTEVIVVDDGSTDDTPRVVQAFLAGRDGWRVLRRPEPSSPGAARNAGVEHVPRRSAVLPRRRRPVPAAAPGRLLAGDARREVRLRQVGRAAGGPGPRRLARPHRTHPRHQPGRAAVLPRGRSAASRTTTCTAARATAWSARPTCS